MNACSRNSGPRSGQSVPIKTTFSAPEANASTATVRQLSDQRNSISGVSLDEEASNLIRYQNAYQAAAKIITTISDLTQTVINIIR